MSVSWEFGSGDYSFRRTLLPHIDAALQGGLHTGSDLTARLGLIYSEGGRWKEAEDLFVQVMETTKRVLGEEHPDSLTSIANLVSTYRNQGWWKQAEELQVRVVETKPGSGELARGIVAGPFVSAAAPDAASRAIFPVNFMLVLP